MYLRPVLWSSNTPCPFPCASNWPCHMAIAAIEQMISAKSVRKSAMACFHKGTRALVRNITRGYLRSVYNVKIPNTSKNGYVLCYDLTVLSVRFQEINSLKTTAGPDSAAAAGS